MFREDDRGSKAILRFGARADDHFKPSERGLIGLVHALFFARWCNRAETLDAIDPRLLDAVSPAELRAMLTKVPLQAGLPARAWCNETAYPVEDISWKGERVDRLDTAAAVLRDAAPLLTEKIVDADGNVAEATATIGRELEMANDFPIFMAVMDLAWFRPDVVRPR